MLGVIAVTAALVVPAGTAAAQDAQAPVVPEQVAAAAEVATDSNRLARELEFRRTFGLRADDDYVAGLLADPRGLNTEHGALLTPEEGDDFDRRVAVANALDQIDAYAAEAAPDTYAGVYTDQAAGGLVYVGFTRDGASHLGELRKRFAFPELLRVFPAQRTAAELKATSDNLTEALPGLRAEGFDVRIVATNIATNSVEVSLGSPRANAAEDLRQRFGSGVQVITESASPVNTDRTNDGIPFKGGIEEYTSRASCTSAFVVRRMVGNLLQPSYDYFMITAGHCFPLGVTVNHFVFALGPVVANSWPAIGGSSATDALLIDIPAGTESRQIIKSGASTYLTMTGQLTTSASYRQGDPVCQSGKTTGYSCGSIVNSSATVTYSGPRTLTDQVIASYDSCPGDSGGAEFRDSTAMGIVSGRTDGAAACGAADAIFTKISNAGERHNVQVNR